MASYKLATQLPRYLRDIQLEVEQVAKDFGLDVFPTIFEVVAYDQMNELASYGGFPVRYPHWRFGMEYEQLSKSSEYGLAKIYEMVINNSPAIAYLLEGNSIVDQKLVMTHVYGHVDFFKNNFAFKTTNQGLDHRTGEPIRKWIDTMANHGAIVRRWADRVGIDKVEEFIDSCLSLENLIDPQKPFLPPPARTAEEPSEEDQAVEVSRLRVEHDYMEEYINPQEFLDRQREELEAEREKARRTPEKPDRDVLGFLLEHAPLERWERDVLQVIRREAYYFWPQMQTKIMNEGWACVAPDTLVYTDIGLLPMRDVVAGRASAVSDGDSARAVYDQNVIRDHATVTIRTGRGLQLTGSDNHRVMLADGQWRRLDELREGDRLRISGGEGMWPSAQVPIRWRPAPRGSLPKADASRWASPRQRVGAPVRGAGAVAMALEHDQSPHGQAPSDHAPHGHATSELATSELATSELATSELATSELATSELATSELAPPQPIPRTGSTRGRGSIRVPERVDERLGAFLGYLVAAGRISRDGRSLTLATADEPQAVRFVQLAIELFGVSPTIRQDGERLRVDVTSQPLVELLTDELGLARGSSAADASAADPRVVDEEVADEGVPAAVLRSPEPVVRAFLRACFDCAGHAGELGSGEQGVVLRAASDALAEQTQLLLLHCGILCRRHRRDGVWHLQVTGASAARFADRIGFEREAPEAYAWRRGHLEAERWDDEVVSIEHGRGDVYDISVEETHRYVAAGLVNHNSFWHSKMMTEKVADDGEIVDYAERNASVMETGSGKLNPYKLGVELYRHIEDRWNRGQFGKEWEDCDSLEARRNWDRRTGLGRQKIFEVRSLYNDVTFIDEFLTPDFVADQKLYTFGFNQRNDRYEIESRKFQAVKEKLLFSLTNAGQPFIYVLDSNHENRGELLLWHDHQGVDLKLDWARDVMRSIERVWRRPVELHTKIENKPALLRFDGKEHVQRPLK